MTMRVNKSKEIVEAQRELLKLRKYAKPDLLKGFTQLCWNCARSRDCSCSWSSRLKPIDDWNAVVIKNEERVSFLIFECPMYIPIHEVVKRKCAVCGKEFLSSGNLYCSYECGTKYNKIERNEKECKI